MAHFAHINSEQTVCSVIVISQETLDASGGWTCPECGQFGGVNEWVQTSSCTTCNALQEVNVLDEAPLRKNFAAKGFTYDIMRDAFISPKPFASFLLNEQDCVWEAPQREPQDGKAHKWSEETKSWIEIIKPITPEQYGK